MCYEIMTYLIYIYVKHILIINFRLLNPSKLQIIYKLHIFVAAHHLEYNGNDLLMIAYYA